MGLGLLKDAAVRERRRLLAGADMAAAVRRPRRAQIGALVDRERQAHRRLAATASGDERRGWETLVTGLNTNALRSSSAVAGKFMVEQEDASFLLQIEGPLCNNVLSESRRPQAELTVTGAALVVVDGGCQTHGLAVTTTSDEPVRLQQMKQPAEQADANVLEVEGPLCSNVVSESLRPQAQLTGAALIVVDGGCQTHRRAVSATSEAAGGLETLMPGQHTTLLLSSSAAAGKFSKVDSQDSDSDGNDSMMMPIFVRHGSGELTFTVRMDQSTKHLMQLYAQRTKTTLDSQYFVYERKRLEPHHTWLSYGLKRDTTVHVCTRLLGGAGSPNLQDYINNNKHKFVEVVPLPDGRSSLEMTMLGCQFLSSWMRCFTAAFITGKSWNGKLQLMDFKFVEGHVRYTKKPTKHSQSSSGSVGEDLTKFVREVEHTFLFGHMPNLVSSYPPYLQSCMKMLRGLVGPLPGPLTAVPGALSNKYELLLDTLVCCMTSNARERLIIELFRKYEGADENEASVWHSAINGATCPDRHTLLKSAIFKYFIQKKNGTGKPYPKDKTGTFILLRDVVMHAEDCNENPDAPKSGDAVELMIADTLKDFLPDIIKNLIENNVDISAELLAAITCACNICDSSH